MSSPEKDQILRQAEKDRLVCHATKEDEKFIKKLLYGLALLGALALIYYFYRHSIGSSHEPSTIPMVKHYQDTKKPVKEVTIKKTPAPEEIKKEAAKPA